MIYVGSPYTHPDPVIMKQREHQAAAYTAWLLRNGHKAFSPIVHGHALAIRFDLPRQAGFWLDLCLDQLQHATALHVLTLDGWEKSVGLSYEIAFARKNEIPVVEVANPDLIPERKSGLTNQ